MDYFENRKFSFFLFLYMRRKRNVFDFRLFSFFIAGPKENVFDFKTFSFLAFLNFFSNSSAQSKRTPSPGAPKIIVAFL